jgi:hypothetical protein
VVESLQSLDLSEAQKRDARFYVDGAKVWFVRDYGRFKRGDCCEVARADERGVALRKDGQTTTVSYKYAARFTVAKTHQLELAKGDRLQLKFNGDSIEGKTVRNGELVTICRVLKDKGIRVRDDAGTVKTLSPEQRMFVPGYAVTSYASQGKTVDTVIAAYGEHEAMPVSTNSQQWYVAISRARKKVLVLTEDKEALRLCVERETDRELALSVAPDKEAMESVCAEFSEETQELLRAGLQAQRHESVMRWVRASHAQQQTRQKNQRTAQRVVPPILPQTNQQPRINRGIRI